MRIEVLYFDGCPGHERLLPRLQQLLEQRGISEPVLQRRIESEEQAISERFLGSPTLRIDGVDVEPSAAERTDFGLKCRLYRTVGGRTQGTPEDKTIADALDAAR